MSEHFPDSPITRWYLPDLSVGSAGYALSPHFAATVEEAPTEAPPIVTLPYTSPARAGADPATSSAPTTASRNTGDRVTVAPPYGRRSFFEAKEVTANADRWLDCDPRV